jgi:hypothetical protein
VNGALLAAIITSVSALLGTIAIGVSTGKAAKRNTEATREVEDKKVDLDSYEAQVTAWRADVVLLRAQRAEDRREYEAHRQECAARIGDLTAKIETIADEKDELLSEVVWLRRDRADQIRRDHARAAFETEIVDWINEWLPRAREMGLDVSNPPAAPDLASLITATDFDPDPSQPLRRWSDRSTRYVEPTDPKEIP